MQKAMSLKLILLVARLFRKNERKTSKVPCQTIVTSQELPAPILPEKNFFLCHKIWKNLLATEPVFKQVLKRATSKKEHAAIKHLLEYNKYLRKRLRLVMH